MKLTLPWLKDHLETDADVATIAAKLTSLGLEVERVTDPAAALAGFVVGEVVACGRHPNAERLSLCTVDDGKARHQVVCGAPNVRRGMKGVFAAVGSVIPATGDVLRKAQIRGVESHGMLCSARELELGDDHQGIIELPEDAVTGAPATTALAIEGPVIDVAITPDRADCLGVHGIARDLAAAGVGRLIEPDLTPVPTEGAASPAVSVDFAPGDASACPLFTARRIRGVRNGPSPDWLRKRLEAIGLRPISALVDVTNYLTFDMGRPLHVFDAAKLRGDLRLHLSRGGERLAALDGRTHTIPAGATVISDDSGVISLGGIVGGESTAVGEATTDVVLEAALFDPQRTARTGRALGIESDARARFERGVDPQAVLPLVELATRMIVAICGGTPAPVFSAGAVPDGPPPVRFRIAQVARLAGVEVEREDAEACLRALGFRVEGGPELYDITPPSWRHDISTEACIIEEIARVHGFDRIAPVSLRRETAVNAVTVTPAQRRRSDVRRALAARGLAEAVTWSFQPEDWARAFGEAVPARLLNPISAELSVLRPSILANLAAAAGRNAAHGADSGGLFEIGPRYTGDRPGEQVVAAAGLRWGAAAPRHWAGGHRPVDAIDAKADALAALSAAGIKAEQAGVEAGGPAWYHPGRCGRLTLGPQVTLARFGELHPRVLKLLDLTGPAVGFEIDLDTLPRLGRKQAGRARPPLPAMPYPAVERDFAFVVDEGVPVETILKAARQAEKELVREIAVFDVFRGAAIGEGRKSVAISVRLQSPEHTLDETAIEAAAERITAAVAKAAGAVLRS